MAILSGSEMPALGLMRLANCRQICSAAIRASSLAATVTIVRVAGLLAVA